MTANPSFAAIPRVTVTAGPTTANTATDGTGTIDLIFTAGASGSEVDLVMGAPLGTNSASIQRFWFRPNSGAGWQMLPDQLPAPATTLSTTAVMPPIGFAPAWRLEAGNEIGVSTTVALAAGYEWTVSGADL